MIIPYDLLAGKKIVLGVSGSIALYKSLELTRLFTKAGAQVHVVMSEAAKKFVTPLTFETLSTNAVLDETSESWSSDHNHIKFTQDADLLLIAPATANTIAKLSNGVADTMLTQVALAFDGKKLIAPSANTNMLHNTTTQHNLQKLLDASYGVIATQSKELACKTVGDGAMAEPIEIFWRSVRELLKSEFWSGRSVVVSGGGTVEKIDDVRYLSNFSSGKMATAVATALYTLGADVTLIASRYDTPLAEQIRLIEVQSSQAMHKALQETLATAEANAKKIPYLFMAAAVSDYTPMRPQSGKLKKESLGEEFTLHLKKNSDILASLKKDSIVSIGFKAEMDSENGLANATKMLQSKHLDAVCLNILKDSESFGTSTNAIEFITSTEQISFANEEKLSLSYKIANAAKNLKEHS